MLSVKHTEFSGQLWNGISFAPFDIQAQNCGGLNVSHGVFGTTGNAGIYVRGCFHTIDHTSIDFSKGGGIVAIASAINVKHVNVVFSRYFGILLVNTIANIRSTHVDFTDAGPLPPNPNDVLGDAIVLWSTTAPWAQGGPARSVALLENNTTFDSERTALYVLGGHADLKNNLFVKQSIDIIAVDNEGFPATLGNLGGNDCLLEGVNMRNDGCQGSGLAVTPPPAVGGLE